MQHEQPMSMPDGFRMPPHNIEAEQGYLGAIMINNETYHQTADDIEAGMFFEPVHGRIFRAVADMIDNGRVANPVTLRLAFESDPALIEVNGAQYLKGLCLAAESILNGRDYAAAIRELYLKRRLINRATESINLAYDGTATESASQISQELSRDMADLSAMGRAAEMISAADVLKSVMERVTADKPTQISAGYRPLDKALSGGMRAGLYGIEGRDKQFKSGFMTGVFESASIKNHVPALYVTMELSPDDVIQRLVSGHAGFGFNAFEKPERREARRLQINEFTLMLEQAGTKSMLAHTPGISIQNLLTLMSKAIAGYDVRLFVVDYWQLITGKAAEQTQAGHLEDCAYRLAQFAAKNQITVMIASQLNRQGHSLGSDGLRRACSWLATIHREEINSGTVGMPDYGIWLEVTSDRYGPGEDIGSKFAPVFKIAYGPVLREWDGD